MGGVEDGEGERWERQRRGEGGGRREALSAVPSAQLSTIPGSQAPWRVQDQKRKFLVHTQPEGLGW